MKRKNIIVTLIAAICGVLFGWLSIINAILKSETMRNSLTKALANKIQKILYGESSKEFVFETRREAERILDKMESILRDYGYVSINDLYDLYDLCGYKYEDPKSIVYGWTNLRAACVKKSKCGYSIELPNTVPLKR